MADILRNRPLLLIALGLVIGLTLREYPLNGLLLVPVAILVREVRKLPFLAVAFLLGWWLSPVVPKQGVMDTRFIQSTAQVISVPRLYPDRIAYTVEMQGYRLAVTEPAAADRSLGDRLHLSGLVKPLREGSEDYLLAKGIIGRFQVEGAKPIGEGAIWYRWAAAVRKEFVAFTHRTMTPEKASVLDALCFNVEGGLTDEFEENLRATNTIHIISASGLHVLLLAMVLNYLLGLLPIPRIGQLLLLGALLAFYAAAAGLQPAIIRSVLMSMVALSAYLWRRESDLLSGLALSAVAYLLYEPLGIYNIGFQFSFLTVAAFGLFAQLKDSFKTSVSAVLKEKAGDAFRTTVTAFCATLPILWFYFGAVSIVAIPANLLIIPAAELLIVAGMIAFALSSYVPVLGQVVSDYLLSPVVSYLESCIGFFAGLPRLSLPDGQFSAYWLIPVYVIMCWSVRERVRPA